MNKAWLKKLLPHIVAISIFLIVSLVYCKPALEGKVLQQSDIKHANGAMQNSINYSKTHDGQFPLWSNGLFSGMPAYQIGGVASNIIASYTFTIITLGLPKPFQFFFLASICFYFLCMALKINPYVGIMGALAFAYATYNPLIISAGHDTKMLSIAFMPAVLGSILLIYQKKYWIGTFLAALFLCTMIAMNHVQIVYYLFIVIATCTLYYTLSWIKTKQWKHLFISAVLTALSISTGIFTNATLLLTTYEYQKETIRGGSSELTDSALVTKPKSSTGLDKDYALSYSMNIAEPLILIVPKIFGGSSDKAEIDADNSKAIEALGALPPQLQQQLPMQYYWGGMTKAGEVGTSGPAYVGAIICMLAVLSFFFKNNKYRWWILAAVTLSIFMSWGSYFISFNELLYRYLPFYNKFRAPSMILVIPQLLLTLSAAIAVNNVLQISDKKELLPLFKKAAITILGLFALLFLLYFSFDFLSGTDKEVLKQVRQSNQPQLLDYIKSFNNGLIADRQSLMLNSILRSLGFILLASGVLFLFAKNKLKPIVLCGALTALILLDVMLINTKYFNADNFAEKEESPKELIQSKSDNEILKDTSNYRVFNVSGSFAENNTSYLYQSVGGYHPAKLRLYQDLIEHQLSKQELNYSVLNMLNAKYIIQKDKDGITQQYQKNSGALGSCWLVKNINYVPNANAEMNALNNFNAKDTAIVQEKFKPLVKFLPTYDSSASISLIKNDNDKIEYNFTAATNQFAVFSEIYYTAGWKAFIDNNEAPIVKTNYVLRGLSIPAGKHKIEFIFKPASIALSKILATAGSIMLCILLMAAVMVQFFAKPKDDLQPN